MCKYSKNRAHKKAARDLGEYTGASLKKLASIVSKELKVNWE